MTFETALTSIAVWTPAGVWTNVAPTAIASGTALAPWRESPLLSAIHPRVRRPHALAVALIQLAHVLLSTREAMKNAPPLQRSEVDILLGTVTGSAVADFEFWSSVKTRGAAFGSPATFVYTLPTAALAEIALGLGVRGALATVSAGRVSGLASIVRSASRICKGQARACICGGVEFTGADKRRASGLVEQDAIALFLVEAVRVSNCWPTIRDWELGFALPQHPRQGAGISASSLLTELASVAIGLGTSSGIKHVLASSSDGHWAKMTLASPQAPGGNVDPSLA